MSERRPRLSVIVPLYQSMATVEETVRSSLADEVGGVEGGVEVVVVDDGSTDGGPRVVGEVMRKDARVRMVHRKNGGLAAARNTGITEARGEWLRFLDADDLAVRGSAVRLIRHAERRELDAACAGYELIDERGGEMGRECPARGGGDGTIGVNELLEGNACGVGTVVLRREALGAVRFDERLRVCEDWDLWARLCGAGMRIGVRAGGPVVRYRVRRASLSKDFAAMLHVGRGVMESAFARARAGTGGCVGVDASAERESAARVGQALEWATMRAVADAEGRMGEATEMFRFGGGGRFSAMAAASAALWGALLGLGIRPEAPGLERDTWLRRVRAWWASCAEHGWLHEDEVDKTWGALAELTAPAREVARLCVEAAREDGAARCGGIVVIGAGTNGRAVARAAEEAGVDVVFRDDRLDAGELDADDLPEGATWEPMETRIDGRPVVVAIGNDAGIVSRMGDGGMIRWRVVQRALARSLEKEMRADSVDLRLGRRGASTTGR